MIFSVFSHPFPLPITALYNHHQPHYPTLSTTTRTTLPTNKTHPPTTTNMSSRAAECVHLIEVEYPNTGLSGIHHVTSKGKKVVADKKTMVQLKAYHSTGKDVDFSSPALIQFLKNHALRGVGGKCKYQDVEYEFSEILGWTLSGGLPCYVLKN
jgi:hypothetical protein